MIWCAGRDDERYDIPVRLLQFAARPSIFPCLLFDGTGFMVCGVAGW